MTAGLITIGNEILLGRTLNSNLAFIGARLAEVGVPLVESRTIRDEPDEITRALAELWPRCDVLLTTGGLGPTKDDLTKATIAAFFGRQMKHDEHTWQRVKERFARRHLEAPELNRNQALVPVGFDVLDNDHGTAPGLALSQGGKLFFAMPGVPAEMKFLLTTHIVPRLMDLPGRTPLWVRTMHTSGIPESTLAERLSDVEPPAGVNLAWLPQPGKVSLRVYGRDHQACQTLYDHLRQRLGSDVWGEGDDTPAHMLHEALLRRGLTLSVAESCTGGMVTAELTAFAGSSGYLLGGVAAYSNAAKMALLGVPGSVLEHHGAVSEEAARAMAGGVRAALQADMGLAITGVAGPSGGTPDKPVGTVHIAVATGRETRHELLMLSGDRERVRRQAADRVLLLAMQTLDDYKGEDA